MPESILCATIPFDARFASDDSSHDAYPHRRRRSRHAQAISGAIDEKPMCFKGFMRVSKFLRYAHALDEQLLPKRHDARAFSPLGVIAARIMARKRRQKLAAAIMKRRLSDQGSLRAH